MGMIESQEENRHPVVVLDNAFSAELPALAAEFPKLKLIDDVAAADATKIEAIIAQADAVTAELLDMLPSLNIVLKMGRNYANIDVEAARGRGLTLAAVPRKGPNCVAEMALTFILSLSKDLLISHESVASGAYRLRGIKPERTSQRKHGFQWMKNARVHEIGGKTLGIVGMGEIGIELARRAAVMDMEIIYHKRSWLPAEIEARYSATYCSFDELLAQSDYICLAVPHTSATDKMIGAAELAKMKPSAFLVNVGRGGVVDEDALITALQTDQIAGAGLDVFTYEPLQADSPLCELDNVIMVPHLGGGTGSSRAGELRAALVEMDRLLSGQPPTIAL